MPVAMQHFRLGLSLGLSSGLGLDLIKHTGRCNVGVLLKCPHRTKSKLSDNNKTGEAIKQLNKENKYLFGELLDRPKPAKNNGKPVIKKSFYKPRPFVQPLDGIQSEMLWSKSKKELGLINDEVTRHRPSSSTTHKFTYSSEYVTDTDLCPSQNEELPQSFDSSIESTDDIDQEVEMCTDVTRPSFVSKPILETSVVRSLELPDIIVRNIPTFPMFNKENVMDNQPTCSRDILSIARESNKYLAYPSVSKILNATMSDASRAALDRWRQKMIAELGEEGFLKYSNNLLAKGSEFHRAIHDHLSGVPHSELHVSADIEGSWKSLSSVIPDLSSVKVLESHVVHPKLMYHGVIDCVAEYKKKLVLIEWKKSDKLKKELAFTYDAPLQLAAYLGAINFDRNYDLQVKGGLVVVAYTDGTPAQVFQLSQTECARHWSLWLLRLQKYWEQQNKSPVEATTSALSL